MIPSAYKQLFELFKNSNHEFLEIRRMLHQIPEHGYQEFKTAKFVQNLLNDYGYEIQKGFGVTGFTAVLDSGKPGKVVALRTELDGIHAVEENDVPYKSQHDGCMHGCGHDGHMATILMLAKHLKDHKHLFKGKIKFVFQPAEEGGAGALKMIEDGALEHPKVDAIFAYHNLFFEKHKILVKNGPIMAGADVLDIHIEGTGGHGSSPWLAKSPLYAGLSIANAINTMKAQENIFEHYVLHLTEFNSGSGPNVIPAQAHLMYGLRTFSSQVRESIVENVEHILEFAEKTHGVKCDLKRLPKPFPSTNNHLIESQLIHEMAEKLCGKSNVELLENPVMASEDFSFFLEHIPGCMFFVGNGEHNINHKTTYDFDDDIIPTAAIMMAAAAIEWLNRHSQ